MPRRAICQHLVRPLIAAMLLLYPGIVQAQPNLTENPDEQREKTGYYRVRLVGVPYRLYHETRLLYGWEPNNTQINRYVTEPDEPHKYRGYAAVTWHVTAPTTYNRAMPPGLLVFIVTSSAGKAPEAWTQALDELNLVFIEISTGNSRPNEYTHAMALHAIELMAQRYPLDRRRIYLAGETNGANTALTAAVLTPQAFRSTLLINGGTFLEDLTYDGKTDEGLAPLANRDALRTSKSRAQIIFFNTHTDIERAITLTHATAYQRAGFRGVSIWDEKELGTELPGPEWLTKAIDLFDSPLHRDAQRAATKADRDLARGRKLDALQGFLVAAASAPTTDFGKAAREQATALLAEYDQQVNAIQEQIQARAFAEAQRALGELRRAWDDHAKDDIERLETQLREASRRRENPDEADRDNTSGEKKDE